MNNEEKILEMLIEMKSEQTSFRKEVNGRFELIDEHFNSIDERFELIDGRFNSIDERFELIDERFNSIDERFELTDGRFNSIDERFESLETQVNENTDIIKAVLHNQEFAMAKLEQLEKATASADGLQRLDTKFNILNDRLFQQETEIRQLRIVK